MNVLYNFNTSISTKCGKNQLSGYSSSISERVWNYMQFKCENGILKGLEKTAFQLHCSERQLQRIMNEFQLRKIGKGTYQIKTREEPKKRD